MAKIILDAGHGGSDPGIVFKDRLEKEDTLKLVRAIGSDLENRGVEVVYTRSYDACQTPYEKVRLANERGGDLLVSIHRNYCPIGNTRRGVVSYIDQEGGMSELAGENINRNLQQQVGYENNGVAMVRNMAILVGTDMPAVMVEVGYINNDEDNRIFDEQLESVANAIANGIVETIEESQMETEEPETYRYRIQVGLFRVEENAYNLQMQLQEEGYDAQIMTQGDLYGVQIGDFDSLDAAAEVENRLRLAGYNTLLIAV